MFNRIKDWIIGIGGALIGALLFLLGMKNRKIRKLNAEGKVKDAVIKETGISKNLESEHTKKAVELHKEAQKTIEAVKNEEKSYNDIIRNWNRT